MNKEEQENRAKLNRYNFQEGKLAGKQEILDELRKIKDRNRPEEFGYIVSQFIKDNSSPSEGGE